jgi:hypothetical protein
MASLKQATYIRAQYPDAKIYIYYIDMRTPGYRYEKFYNKLKEDENVFFIKGKVAEVDEDDNGNVTVVAEDAVSGEKLRLLLPRKSQRLISKSLNTVSFKTILTRAECLLLDVQTSHWMLFPATRMQQVWLSKLFKPLRDLKGEQIKWIKSIAHIFVQGAESVKP